MKSLKIDATITAGRFAIQTVTAVLLVVAMGLPAKAGNIFDDDGLSPKLAVRRHPASPGAVSSTPGFPLAIPAIAELTESRRQLKAAFEMQLKDSSPAARGKLAQMLLDECEKPSYSPADRFAILGGALGAAKEARNLRQYFDAADKLDKMFDVEGLALKTEAASKTNLRAPSETVTLENIGAVLELIDPLLEAGNFTDADHLLKSIRVLVAGHADLRAKIVSRSEFVESALVSIRQIQPSLEKLKTSPLDPAANLAVGNHYCLRLAQWEKGLPFLALGSDASLKQLAAAELSGASGSNTALKLADEWWKRATANQTPASDAKAMKLHAANWYRAGQSDALGLQARAVEARLKEAAALDSDAGSKPPAIIRSRTIDDKQIVLFGGTDTTHWEPQWPVADSAMVSANRDTYSKEKFTDFKLHLEFNEPQLDRKIVSQARGNSGVFLQGRYEIQILDSYENTTYPKGGCGAVYGIADPLKNVAKPPGQWQTYDITFHAARYTDGRKTENARVTLYWNGELVQNNTAIPGSSGGQSPEADTPGPIGLQFHGNSVAFRNIRIAPIGETSGNVSPPPPSAVPQGFVPMFNGTDLTGWRGYQGYWSARDGMIIGSEVKEKSKHTFLIYTGIPQISDFEMHYKYKFATPSGNSGVQYRSKVYDELNCGVGGYQADCDGGGGYDGTIYDEHGVAGGRGTMSGRGQKVTWDDQNKRHNEPFAEPDAELKKFIKIGDWNDVVLIADGNHMTYTINGHLMTDLTDNSPNEVKEGVIALQIHGGFTMDIQFKDLEIKLLKK